MVEIKNKFAIGCLIQWYEIEMVGEYLQSVKNSIKNIDNKENIIVDLYFNCDQTLEKVDESQMSMVEVREKFDKLLFDIFDYEDNDEVGVVSNTYNLTIKFNMRNNIYTIADYRREFNENYCDKVDVLMWGESDALIPKQTFEILDNMHTQVKDERPKYITFFGMCKMWDDSWKVLEHPDFTDKPFYDSPDDFDPKEHWWS